MEKRISAHNLLVAIETVLKDIVDENTNDQMSVAEFIEAVQESYDQNDIVIAFT
jgi:hypothetical protein